jgi:hypothetical protein
LANLDRLEAQNRTYALIIATALFFTPYTAIKIYNFGMAELLIVILFIKLWTDDRLYLNISRFVFVRFWVVFFIISSLGIIVNYFVFNHISGTTSGLIFDSTAYLFILFCCFCLEAILNNRKIRFDLEKLLKNVYISTSTALLVLFLISRGTGSLFGFSLLNYDLFRPFATNIHHTAMFVAPLPFLGLHVISKEKRLVKKILILILVISNVVIALNTGSTKVIMGFIIGAVPEMHTD